jgi:NAD(P)-dependent dehydrogenase (short-subunit alcohol dehydrogenase family)
MATKRARPRAAGRRRNAQLRPVLILAGATGGIGPAIARRAAAGGWELLLVFRKRESEARALAREAAAIGARAECCKADLLHPGAADGVVRAAVEAFGRVDAVVLAVGDLFLGAPTETAPADLRAQLESNVVAPWSLALAAIPQLKKSPNARILFFGMAGAGSLRSRRLIAAHAVAKAAVLGLARSLASELARDGIVVLTIAPGVVKTQRSTKAAIEPFLHSIPTGHVNTPEDVAEAVMLGLAPTAAPMTGMEIPVANGFGL